MLESSDDLFKIGLTDFDFHTIGLSNLVYCRGNMEGLKRIVLLARIRDSSRFTWCSSQKHNSRLRVCSSLTPGQLHSSHLRVRSSLPSQLLSSHLKVSSSLASCSSQKNNSHLRVIFSLTPRQLRSSHLRVSSSLTLRQLRSSLLRVSFLSYTVSIPF